MNQQTSSHLATIQHMPCWWFMVWY